MAGMTEAKPMASLTPLLLARKGGARPAMRSQMQPFDSPGEALAQDQEDFAASLDATGDQDADQDAGANVVALNPASPEIPAVRHQQAHLATRLAEGGAQPPVRRSALAEGRSAAFTLRLDADRHLKLRLACTLANCSAQQFVTEALDQVLASLPDVADLAARVSKHR